MTNENNAPERASTGILGLDDVLRGGFPQEQMYLVEGDPGAGKTTLGLQFLRAGVLANQRCLYVVLAETVREVRRLAHSHGWSLDGMDVAQAVTVGMRADQEYTFYHPAEVELEEVVSGIVATMEQLKPTRVVFDSLSELRLLAQDKLRYRRQVLALKDYFHSREMTVLLLDFLSHSEDRQLESLCHGIVSLEQLVPVYGGQRRRLRVKKLRESGFRDGYHDFTIQKGGLEVYPRLVASEHHAGYHYQPETCSSGIRELDKLLGGGLDRGTSTLIMGPAGVGKSTLTAQYAKAAVERGEKAALFIFDEVPNTFVVRGEGLGLGIREHVAAGRMTIDQVDPAQLSPGAFAHRVREAVASGARLVVIDSINGYQSAMPEESFLHAHLHELLAYLNGKQIITLLVMTQQGLVGQGVTSPIELSYLADTIILLRYFEHQASVRQAISVVKRRTGPHERTIRELSMSAQGVAIGRVLTEFSGLLSGQLVVNEARRARAADENHDGGGQE